MADDLIDGGYHSAGQPLTTKQIKNVLRKWSSNHRRMAMRYLRLGRRLAIRDAKREG